MRMIVCVKQVPDSLEVRLDPVSKTIQRDQASSILNPFDAFALEEALRLKERFGGSIQALSMGIPAAASVLSEAMSLGADGAALLSDRAFAGADTLATGYALGAAIGRLGGFDLILCGRMATDGDTAQVPPILAVQLGIPCLSDVCEILSVSDTELLCRRMDDEYYSVWSVRLPALITVTKECNVPRLPSIKSLRYARGQDVRVLTAADLLGLDRARIGLSGSPTQVCGTYVPVRHKSICMLEGAPAEQAECAAKLLIDRHFVQGGAQ